MIKCSLFRCLDRQESNLDSRFSDETISIGRLVSENIAELENCPSLSCEVVTERGSDWALNIDSELFGENLMASKANSRDTGCNVGTAQSSKWAHEVDNDFEPTALKLKASRSNTTDTGCAHDGKRNSDFLKESTGSSFLKNKRGPRGVSGSYGGRDRERLSNGSVASKHGTFLGSKEFSSAPNLGTCEFSDWNECYTSGEIRISQTRSGIVDTSEGNFSDLILSPIFTLPTDNNLFVHGKITRTIPELPFTTGMVWAMIMKKSGWAFHSLNLRSSVRKIVDTFLKVETGLSLPVSFTLSTNTQPKLLPAKKMSMTLSQNLMGYFDEATQGLTFFVGPVNGKLCYKMTVCDLKHMQKCFATTKKRVWKIE